MKLPFSRFTDKRSLISSEERVRSFERSMNITLPGDYRDFLIRLEAYIDVKRNDPALQEDSSLEEHIDDIFCDYYFLVPGIEGEFNITDMANLDLGYSLLTELQKDNGAEDHLVIGNIWHSSGYHYCLSLSLRKESFGQVYLLSNNSVNNELNLAGNNDTIIFVAGSFKKFLADL